MDFETVSRAIEAARAAEEAETALEYPESLELGVGAAMLWGLILFEGEEAPPVVMHAADQYLEMRGKVDDDVLQFQAGTFDDLHVRAALLEGGTQLVDEFRDALLADRGVEHALHLVPPAFAQIVDDQLALDLYAAAVALMARLSAGGAAGCLAEEILAVELLRNAEGILQAGGHEDSAEELFAIFDLFGDDDVLQLFEMKEPSDAAVAGHDDTALQLGVVDQRPEAWFSPFGDVALTGYLTSPDEA